MAGGQRVTLSNRSMDLDRAHGFCAMWQGSAELVRGHSSGIGARDKAKSFT